MSEEIEKDEWFKNINRKATSTNEMLELHKYLCERGREVMSKKNSDYANPKKSADPFRNFRAFGAFGILVRMSDKISRLQTFIEKAQEGQEMLVRDENWEDTIVDVINYATLLDGYIRSHGIK